MKLFRLFKVEKLKHSSENKEIDMPNESASFNSEDETKTVIENEGINSGNDQQIEPLPSFSIFDLEKITEIKDDGLLSRIAKESDSFIIGTKAVSVINDESVLVDIAKCTHDGFVRKAALDKLSDESLLLVAKGSSGKAFSDQVFSQVSERIKNPLTLIELLNFASKDYEWDQAVQHIKDQKILAKVALKLKYLTARGLSILQKIEEPHALAYIVVNAEDGWMKEEAFRKLEKINSDLTEDVKNGKITLIEYLEGVYHKEPVKDNGSVCKLRFRNDNFQYSEIIKGWEVFYTSDLYQELTKLNIKGQEPECLLDGVKLKPLNPDLYGKGITIKAQAVCPKCQKMFDIEDFVDAGLGGDILKCTNCGFNFDFHYSGNNPFYYVCTYTYVGKPYDIDKVPKPSIFISDIL